MYLKKKKTRTKHTLPFFCRFHAIPRVTTAAGLDYYVSWAQEIIFVSECSKKTNNQQNKTKKHALEICSLTWKQHDSW